MVAIHPVSPHITGDHGKPQTRIDSADSYGKLESIQVGRSAKVADIPAKGNGMGGRFVSDSIMWLGIFGLLGGLSNGLTIASAEDANPCPAANPQGAIFELNEENDWFAGTDRHYTQGFRMVYLGPDNVMPEWLLGAAQYFPAVGFNLDTFRVGLEMGQNLYTPTDLSRQEPIANDWPYAGWIYAGTVLQRRGLTDDERIPVLENIRLQLGMVGPAVLAGQLQNWFHSINNFPLAEGWANQLPNEPTMALKYQRAWRLASGQQGDWGVECIPQAGASLGNVETSARAGAMVRMGWHIPDDFGIEPIDSLGITDGGWSAAAIQHPWGFYFFVAAEGRAVGYSIFLDGDMFRDSPHVEREPYVGELYGGLALMLGRLEMAFTYVYLTREFVGQVSPDAYGSVFAKWKF